MSRAAVATEPISAPRRFCVGDRIPLVLSKSELAAGLGYSEDLIDTYRKAHNHPAVREIPGTPGHPRFDGRAVQQWLEAGAPDPVRRPLAIARARR